MRAFRLAAGLAIVGTLVHCGIRDAQEEESLGRNQAALCQSGWPATFAQGGGANEWWVEFKIGGGTVQSAYLEVPGRANVVLGYRDTKWSSSLAAKIPTGTQVILHATNSAGASAQTVTFAYLSTTTPATDTCSGGGGSDGGDTCGWSPAITQGAGANEWWVEYAIAGGTTRSASLVVDGGSTVALAFSESKWRGSPSARIPTGATVHLHAEDTSGQTIDTTSFRYLVDAAPALAPCGDTDGGTPDAGTCAGFDPAWRQGGGANEWWIEYAIPNATSASLQIAGGASMTLSLQNTKWSASPTAKVATGTSVVLRATNGAGQTAETSPFRYLVDTAPVTKPCDGGTPDAGGGGSGDPYDPNGVLTYEFTFDAAAMAVLSSTNEADNDKWVHGTFKQGNDVLTDVGFRRKGHSTFRSLPQKAAFKVRFDKYVKGQKWKGYTDLTLNNSMSDPTFISERLSYHLYRAAGLPAERAASAHVTINGANYGLYANIETPNDQLIERLFGANANTLYEINWGSQWQPGVENGFEEDEGDGSYADVHALFNAVQAANDATLINDVSSVLDAREWLEFSAMEGLIGDWDGYAFGKWGSHNYFMAGDVSGRFSLIPWSTDGTLSDRQGGIDVSMPQDVAEGIPTLLGRCKRSTACWSAYKDQMRAVLAVFESGNIVNLAQTWHAQVDPYVVADPKREATLDYYHSESTNLIDWLTGRPAKVRAQLGL